MKIFEIFGLARSGHHAVINWMIKNVCGQEAEMKWKLDLVNGKGVTYINEANLDVEVTLKYINEQSQNTKFLFLIQLQFPTIKLVLQVVPRMRNTLSQETISSRMVS